MNNISAVVITYNEEVNIERCLKSITWCDEIIVVDACSQDRTVEICQTYTDKVFQSRWEGFSKQRLKTLELASYEWVLSIDADEEVTEELAQQIQRHLKKEIDVDGFLIPRRSKFLSKWIEHCGWYPDYHLRLFRKSKSYLGQRAVHEGFSVKGKVVRLDGTLLHYTYRSIFQYLEKMNRYTSLQVAEKLRQKPRLQVRWYNIILNPVSKFWRMFIAKKGYKDGFHGFLLSVFSAMYIMILYAKIWEYQQVTGFARSRKEIN